MEMSYVIAEHYEANKEIIYHSDVINLFQASWNESKLWRKIELLIESALIKKLWRS
jgi:hypothetical protein